MHPALSHYNATYQVATRLKSLGHKIVYVGFEEDFKESVVAQGFDFKFYPPLPFENFSAGDSRSDSVGKKKQRGSLKKYLKRLKLIRDANRLILQGNVFDPIILELMPDLILLDVSYVKYVVPLAKYKKPILLIQTMVLAEKSPLVPPFTSTLVPVDTPWHRLRIAWTWYIYFFRAYWAEAWMRAKHLGIEIGISDLRLLRKLAARNGFPFLENVNLQRALVIGFKNIPELITSPAEFDFPRQIEKNKFYLGLVVDIDRKEVAYDETYSRTIEKILTENEHAPKPIIYCSLGSLNTAQYKGCADFYHRVIEAFRTQTCYNVIIAIGKNIDPSEFPSVPENVFLFRKVPQVDILNYASLMITHGGMQSVTECILKEVPMLVYPLSAKFDQNGNAARVVYHGLGLMGNIKRASKAAILRNVEQLINNPVFLVRVKMMKEKCLVNRKLDAGIDLITSYL
jgi:zeaxanthin glucosyltransferase